MAAFRAIRNVNDEAIEAHSTFKSLFIQVRREDTCVSYALIVDLHKLLTQRA